MLPAVDGLAVCKILKSDPRTQHIPIVMVTAKTEEADVVTGLELGADDYITKPFSPRVLLARVRAVLRRKLKQSLDDPTAIKIHDLVIHPGRHEVLLRGRAGRADVHRVSAAAVPGAQARLGLFAQPDRRRRQGRGLSGHRAIGRRASRRAAQEAGRPGQLHRNGARGWLPVQGVAMPKRRLLWHLFPLVRPAVAGRCARSSAGGAGSVRERATWRPCATNCAPGRFSRSASLAPRLPDDRGEFAALCRRYRQGQRHPRRAGPARRQGGLSTARAGPKSSRSQRGRPEIEAGAGRRAARRRFATTRASISA